MIRAIKAVSSERGRDPREYALVAFGGNGPLFAVAMAEALSIRRVLIPPSAGVFSSYGLLYSDVAYHFTRSRKALLAALDPDADRCDPRRARSLRADAARERRLCRRPDRDHRSAALHYQGQSFELEVPVPAGDCRPGDARRDRGGLRRRAREDLRPPRRRRASRSSSSPCKVVGRGVPDQPARGRSPPMPSCRKASSSPSRCGRAYFGPAHGWRDTDVVNRADLREPRAGPCIVEEYDSTCVVPPGAKRASTHSAISRSTSRRPGRPHAEEHNFDASFELGCRRHAGGFAGRRSRPSPATARSPGTRAPANGA